MGIIKTRLAALEKQFNAMIPPGEATVTFTFDNGEQMTFPNGHAALIFAIKNRNNEELQNVTIETKSQSKASLAKAVLAGDPKHKKKGHFEE